MKAPNAIRLAQKVLASAANKKEQAKLFTKLTNMIIETNPTPFMPREPIAIPLSQEQQQTIRRIQKRGVSVLPGLITNSDSTVTEAENSPENKTYGETPPESIHTLVHILYPNNNTATGAFVDAGSGMGGPTLTAALSGKFPRAKGIELEPKWHAPALSLKQAYDEDSNLDCQLEFLCGNMTLPGSFSDTSCVFMNSVVWDANLCHRISHRLEEDLLASSNAFVVSMSRRLALPSFDLVDVLRLQANERLCTFYVNQRAGNPNSGLSAVSDSSTQRSLRDSMLLETLTEAALDVEERVGMQFLTAMSLSEPSSRSMGAVSPLWSRLMESMEPNASLRSKVLGSMALRNMVDHPNGRRKTNQKSDLVKALIAALRDPSEHPAVRTNWLDILGNLFHDASLSELDDQLDEMLDGIDAEPKEGKNDNMLEALEEVIQMRQWWQGHQREIPLSFEENVEK